MWKYAEGGLGAISSSSEERGHQRVAVILINEERKVQAEADSNKLIVSYIFMNFENISTTKWHCELNISTNKPLAISKPY